MAPLPPTITQVPPTTDPPLAQGALAANLAKQAGDPDAGAATFAKTLDPTAAFTLSGATLLAARVLDGSYSVSVTCTTAGGTSPATTATLTFADDLNPWDDTPDQYPGNAQLPPPLPPDNKTEGWTMFLVPATTAIVRGARNGVDFVVARTAKTQPPANTYWDTALLGARPTAAIEAEARRLAAAWPSGVTPIV